MNRLVAFGCSLTYGTGLPDCWVDNVRGGPHPSDYAWPKILADKLGVECVNRSSGGQSNKEIHNRILTTDIDENDIVIVLWTYNNRWSVNRSPRNVTCILPLHATTDVDDLPWKYTKTDVDKQKLASAYYEYVHDDYDIQNDFNHRLDHAYLHLNRISAKQYHLLASDDLTQQVDWNRNDFVIKDVKLDSIRHPPALDGIHPGVDAHRAYAEELYRILNNT